MPSERAAATFPDVLAARLRRGAEQPLVTYYDGATGERTELSVTTFANWVAKTAGLLVEEYDLDEGAVVQIELPTHWLVPVFLGAAWSAGLAVSTEPSEAADLLVTDQPLGEEATRRARAGHPVLACSLLAFAVRFGHALPPGVDDYGVLWPGQPDAFAPIVAPTGGSLAMLTAQRPLTQAELLEAAPTASEDGVRLLTDAHPATAQCGPAFLGPLLAAGSVVYARNLDDAAWQRAATDEKVTETFRSPPR